MGNSRFRKIQTIFFLTGFIFISSFFAVGYSAETKPRTIESLRKIMHEGDWAARVEAITALSEIGESYVLPDIIAALKDDNQLVRFQAVLVLENVTDESIVIPLINILNDTSSQVRAKAAYILGEVGDLRATEKLIALLVDENYEVQLQAAEALRKITREDFGLDYLYWDEWFKAQDKNTYNIGQ